MAQGDALFFRSNGYRGWRGLACFLFPRLEARFTARWLLHSDDSPWRGCTPDVLVTTPNGERRPLIVSFLASDGALWRIRPKRCSRCKERGWDAPRAAHVSVLDLEWGPPCEHPFTAPLGHRVVRVRRGTVEHDLLAGLVGASMGGL